MKRAIAFSLALSLAVPVHLVSSSAQAAPFRGIRRHGESPAQAALRIMKTPAVITALAIAPVVTGITYYKESARPNLIPLAFSELSQIKRDLAAKGDPMSAATLFLASNNEKAMKIFEAWNLAHSELALGSEAEKFAFELNLKMTQDPHTHKLPQLLKDVPEHAKALRLSMAPFVTATQGMRPVAGNYAAAWHYTRTENTHTEMKCCKEVTTGTGNDQKTERVEYPVEVYDDTTHDYDYNRAAGEAAAAGFGTLRGQVQTISGMPTLQVASRTNAEGNLAQDLSRGRTAKDALTSGENQQIASLWAQGSTYNRNIGQAVHLWNNVLPSSGGAWQAAKGSARSDKYKTWAKHDPSPPQPYVVGERANTDAQAFLAAAEPILAAISNAEATAPILDRKIRELVQGALEKKGTTDPKKLKALTAEIMDIARRDYRMSFEGGVDTKEFRHYVVAIAGLLSLVGAGGLGAAGQHGVNYLRRRNAEAKGRAN